jgi:signal peptidase I
VAAILGFLLPGLGHLYAGLHRRAALLILLFPAAEIVALVLMVLIPFPLANVAVPFALILALRAFLAAAAAREMRRLTPDVAVSRFSRWYSLVAAAVLVAAVVNPLWAYAGRRTFVQSFKFPTGSMENTIVRGDHLLAAMWTYGWRVPLFEGVLFGARPADRGDLVVFPYPEDPGRRFVKRVIGLPGETVEIRQKVVFIDGKAIDEPYTLFLEPPGEALGGLGADWGPMIVPAESYFVLGDNRDNSRDSRYWGFVKQDNLLGRARVLYWSVEPVTERVRWERIGRRLE